mgnify:CR=1 FL=1
MATIRIYDGTNYIDVEVTDEFAAQYAELEHREYLVNRKETRRHQSLDKSMEHGFDVADTKANVFEQVERRLLSEQIHIALHKLTDKQRTVVSLYFFDGLNFREIGERLHIGTSAVFDHYSAAIKKLKKFLEST